MEPLSHNQVIRITDGPRKGIYRVIFDEVALGRTAVVSIPFEDKHLATAAPPAHQEAQKAVKKGPPPLIGALIWLDREELIELDRALHLQRVQVEPASIYLQPIASSKAETLFATRLRAMAPFLDVDRLREGILVHGGLGGLVKEAMQSAQVGRTNIYKCWSLLCRHGIMASSLRPRHDLCGAPGTLRPCDPGGRKKPGRRPEKQRIAALCGDFIPDEQPGMSTAWRRIILAADKAIPTPKPPMGARAIAILASHFVQRFRYEGDALVHVQLKQGEYPNKRQIRRVLEREIPRLQRLINSTTQQHFDRSMRGAGSRSWKGVLGPGHTWAIDSTIGDIYLRSAINRAWIIGRPIVYVIVDVWSTAVVGFFVCLEGPSWAMAKHALFSAASEPALIGELWGYAPALCLDPAPTLCSILLCDRGEYLSRAASQTAFKCRFIASYAPPYRPDMKGIVEVLHRIEKDRQYQFAPGAINARRKEFDLRRIRPADAALTVREYVHYLETVFTEYNLTASREGRLDAHMRAASVMPTPAGLWRWGHGVGLGFRREIPRAELISSLLVRDKARVTGRGVRFMQRQYTDPAIHEHQWIDQARNFGSWDIPCHHFTGSVSRIWTPNPWQSGMLELRLSEQSTASLDLTADEVVDAYRYAMSNNANTEHQRTQIQVALHRRRKEIVARATEFTAEATQHESTDIPTLTEARHLETTTHASSIHPSAPSNAQEISSQEDGEEEYLSMMREISRSMENAEIADANL